uniref:Electrin-5 n=1 Tax=Litoria rubella TaxID=104895 RepID=EI05_LITRU|nr:RecName: Full=Electrin-5 [Litoria rubella]
IYEPEIA